MQMNPLRVMVGCLSSKIGSPGQKNRIEENIFLTPHDGVASLAFDTTLFYSKIPSNLFALQKIDRSQVKLRCYNL